MKRLRCFLGCVLVFYKNIYINIIEKTHETWKNMHSKDGLILITVIVLKNLLISVLNEN